MRALTAILCLGLACRLHAAGPPDAPQGLTAAATGLSGQVLLAWQPVTAPVAATGYHVFHNSVSELAGATALYVTSTTVVVAGLADRALRWFFVASDEAGVGPGLTGSAVSAMPFQPPDAPALTATAMAYSAKVQLNWSQPGTYGAPLGAVQIEALSGGLVLPLGSFAPGVGSGQVSLGCGAGVSLRARAYDAFGTSGAASAPAYLLLPCAPLLAAGQVSGGSLRLNWLDAGGSPVSAWEVRSATGPGFADPLPNLVTVTAAGALGADLPAPAQGQGLWARVHAVDPAGLSSAASAEVSLLAPPQDLAATPLQGRVHLRWSAPAGNALQGVTVYQVYYATYPPAGFSDPFKSVSVTAAVAGTAQSVTITGLTDHTAYWFTVAAQGGSGSAQVGPSSLSVGARPSLPSPVFTQVTSLSGTALSFAWAGVDAAPNTPVGYHLQRSPNPDLSAPQLLTVTAALSVSQVAAPAAGTVAWYFVTVTDTAGNAGSLSPPAQSVLRLPALAAPQVTLVESDNGRVRLRWQAVAEAASYQVHRATQGVSVSAGAFTLLPGGSVSGTEFIDVRPVNGVANAYRLHAMLPIGIGTAVQSSAAGNHVTAVPRVLPGIPGRFGGVANGPDLAHLTAVARAQGGVDLAWTAAAAGSSAISGYRVWRGFSAQSLSVVADLAGPTPTAYSDPDAPLPINALVYGVQAVDQSLAYGPRISGTVGSVLPWPAPLSLGAQVLSGGVRLSWASPSGGGTYALSAYALSRRWQDGGPYDALVQVTSLAYVDLNPDAAQGSQPSYRVQVLDAAGGLGAAVSISASLAPAGPLPGVPTAVSGISAVTLPSPGIPVSLQWRPNPQAEAVSAYRVYRGTDPTPLTETAALAWTDSPGVGASLNYHVQAVNAQGSGISGTAQPAPLFVAPPQPQWVSPLAGVDPLAEGGALTLRLSWQDLGVPANVDAYQLYAQSGIFSGLGSAMLLTDTTDTGFADTLLSPSAQVSYVVLARSGAHASASPGAQLVLQVPPAPGTVAGLSAVARSDGAWLGWDAEPAAVEYWVFRSTAPLPPHPGVALRLTRSGAAFYADGTADGSQAQHYAVASVNGLGRGAAASVLVSPLGGIPATLTAAAGYNAAPEVLLQWTAPAAPQSATGYNVWRDPDPAVLVSGGGTLLSVTAGLSYTDASPVSNTAYHYGVGGFGLTAGPLRIVGPLRAFAPPSAPVGPVASGAPGAVDLSWSPASAHEGVTGWALSLDVGGGLSSALLPLSPTSHRVEGVPAGVSVSFSVRALNSAGGSPFSVTAGAWANAAGAAPQPLSFSALSGFSGGLTTEARVLLSWSAPGAGSVLLYRSSAPMPLSLAAGGPASPIYLTGLSASTILLTDTVQALGQVLDYAISAVSAAGLPGGESAPRLASGVPAVRAPAPVGLSATAGNGRVDLVWGAPADPGSVGPAASPYRLHRRLGGGAPVFGAFTDDPGFPLDLSGTSYVDAAVVNGQTYWYFLSQVDAAGAQTREAAAPRDASGGHASMVPQGPPRPPAPLIAVAGDQSVSLRWIALQSTALSGAKYNVYRRPAGGDYSGPLPELFQVGPAATDFVNVSQVVLTLRDQGITDPLQNTVTYAYSVSAVNAWGEGAKSAEIMVTPFKPLDPGAAGLQNRILNLTVVGKKDVALAWGATPTQNGLGGYDLQFYRVYRSQDGGNSYTEIRSLTSTAMVDDGTSFGVAYTYRVVPVDTQGNEGYSYTLQTVVIPSAVNSILVFRNAFNPARDEVLPLQFALQQPGHVWVKVFTLNGEYVATVFDEAVPTASQEDPFLSERRHWDGRNAAGQLVASGVYLIHMEGPGFRQNARVAVIK